MTTRVATHANSWYTGNPTTLPQQLDTWLGAVPKSIEGVGELPPKSARVIIAPHAGYSYSGPAAAWAYASLDISKVKRVFILGPSHHIYLDHCAVSGCQYYSTPLGNLTVDTSLCSTLVNSDGADAKFTYMTKAADEDEHSLEMHLPYVYHLLSRANKLSETKIVPIMVGAINSRKERAYGKALAQYLADEENVFVVSSDFCHWGTRFTYTHYYPTLTETPTADTPSVSLTSRSRPTGPHRIHESIEALDRLGMSTIETGSHEEFVEYLRKTHNTICGRHPIGVVMSAIETLELEGGEEGKGRFKLVRYEQSSKVTEPSDSSVSYVSAFAVI
ncbi:MEMO1 family [Sphaerosporella brunnea]|uniref:MEMO1 family n=1 Tax=Sphaerosporella brunnea TaxID=1250544 RepID=A0A5J5EQ79_9PEZI|nr:MEMO1 family [Sphaerosporella brunnea]